MEDKSKYWANIFRDHVRTSKAMLIILLEKGIITENELETWVLRLRAIDDQNEEKLLENLPEPLKQLFKTHLGGSS